ncbi:hypothetical protein DVH05_028296 [Phytophthora capsici]|nr:hypothetical protein DVH05_028296 [Phytophthora capsici]
MCWQDLEAELALVAHKTQTNVSQAFPKVEIVGMMLPLGPNGGVSQLPVMGGVVMGNLITRSIKSKDYFAGMTWKGLGAVVPN